ncbi:MAG: DNA cytosine methyltransferase [Bifidobacteriaceae bacterium]|nr:DNA cytosine methyltransferase [Bifidobacteriaceae bacterium]
MFLRGSCRGRRRLVGDEPPLCHPHEHRAPAGAKRRIAASLFSGYGGLHLAVEEVFNAKTVWFSENSGPVARVFGARWPGVPNLGDITQIDWAAAPRVDVLAGGVPCQSYPAAPEIPTQTEASPGSVGGWGCPAGAFGRFERRG